MWILTIVLLAFSTPALAFAECGVIGVNIVANGSAEEGDDWLPGSPPVDIPGWVASDGCYVVRYAHSDTMPPGPICEGICTWPPVGEQFFYGGSRDVPCQFTQTIAIPPDCGSQPLRVHGEAWLGGFVDGAPILEIEITDSSDVVLAALTMGPVTPADRGHQIGTLHLESSTAVPPGASEVALTLRMDWASAADKISVRLESLTPVTPASWSHAKRLYR